jgi:hypothetical protein
MNRFFRQPVCFCVEMAPAMLKSDFSALFNLGNKFRCFSEVRLE